MLSGWPAQIALTLAHVIALVVFLRGFFPTKVVIPGASLFEGESPFTASSGPQFNKVVIMVVDAMRSDFLYSDTRSEMNFLHELINEGNAIPYTAFSAPPTVTLPRLKGITTGGTPSFLDAILNIADEHDKSQGLGSQDSWVSQFLKKGKKINFFGDDTWLKLYPTLFDQFEGTNSFFVSDFTEVDNNVTKHLDTQLGGDWDGLILHYLGLDHIGHKGGPDSTYMKPKQREMDAILKRVYNNVNEDTLIVLMGDHGMNEIGNHGGSSPGETSPGLAFISKKFDSKGLTAPLSWNDDYTYYKKINQIDLVPTLSALLDFPIPQNNLGIILPDFLALWPEGQRNKVLLENCKQFMKLFTAKYGMANTAFHRIYKLWSELKTGGEEKEEAYYELLSKVQNILTASATNYNYVDIAIGYTVLFLSTVAVVVLFLPLALSQTPKLTLLFVIFCGAYAAHFHGSSLIEEEHQIWWFFTISLVVIFAIYYRVRVRYTALIFFGLRLLRSVSNSGQKYFYKLTLGSYLLDNVSLLWILVIITYGVVAAGCLMQGHIERTKKLSFNMSTFIVVFMTVSMSALFKLMQFSNDGHTVPSWLQWYYNWVVTSFGVTSLDDKFALQAVAVLTSKITVFFVFALMVNRVITGKVTENSTSITDFINLVSVYLLHQSRLEHIPIFLSFMLMKYVFTKACLKGGVYNNLNNLIMIVSLFTLCMQNLSFFSFGSTNLLATVDLSNAYNGISEYSVPLVGLQTFTSNFAAPIYWSLSLAQIIFELDQITFKKHKFNFRKLKSGILLAKTRISLVFYAVAATLLVTACINLRFHLFIWTVFSPKLLFLGAWSVLMNAFIDLAVVLAVVYVLH